MRPSSNPASRSLLAPTTINPSSRGTVGPGAEDHPFERFPRPLQRQHLAFHREHGQFRHQLLAPGAAAQHRCRQLSCCCSPSALRRWIPQRCSADHAPDQHLGPSMNRTPETQARSRARINCCGCRSGRPARTTARCSTRPKPGISRSRPVRSGVARGWLWDSIPFSRWNGTTMPLVHRPQPRPLSPSICAPSGDPLKAGLAQLQQIAAQSFGMGRQHRSHSRQLHCDVG